jgi:hypothetical protein
MNKNPSDEFFDSIDFPSIVETIKGIYTSDGTMNTLLDFERVLDESDLYAYQNWEIGELVAGPDVERYQVSCMFMYPAKLMPNPRGAKRLLSVGCNIKFKKTKIKVPVEIKDPGDYKPGTHYPRMIEREVWLVRITMPKELMNDIREGSIDLAGQTINLEELDTAYDEDLDKEGTDTEGEDQGGMGQDMGMGGMNQAPMPAGQVPLGGGM